MSSSNLSQGKEVRTDTKVTKDGRSNDRFKMGKEVPGQVENGVGLSKGTSQDQECPGGGG